MPIVVGVSLRTAGKIYFFDPVNEEFERGERVLVETARGMELGDVKLPPHEVDDELIVPPLKHVVRRATPDDLARDAFNRMQEADALEICKRLVGKLNLPMRLIDAQYTFDGSHVLVHFLADNRVDFRELVRELAHELRTRIELRQVGVRDEAKLLGGYGVCGRQLCCNAFLTNFTPVAITTAKEQGLALNPQKISGMCGRLMCCLAFEHECYREVGKSLPRMNSTVSTPRGDGKVTKLNVLARQVEVAIPEVPGPLWFAIDDLAASSPAEQAAVESCCGGCRAHAEDNLDDELPLSASNCEAAITSEEENEQPAPAGQPRRRRPHRRHKKVEASALSAGAEPANVPVRAQQQSSRPRRRPGKNKAAVPMQAAAPASPETAASPTAVSGQRRRRRRRR